METIYMEMASYRYSLTFTAVHYIYNGWRGVGRTKSPKYL